MGKKNDEKSSSLSIIDEIEDQLREVLSKKKQDVEKELEERIRKEREEAQKRLEDLDKEMIEEREALSDFKKTISEFETNKEELKKQIKDHLDKAIRFQTDIENITVKTLEELKKVRELNQRLEGLQLETGEKVSSLKKNLEEKFGIVAEIPGSVDKDEEEINLDRELTRLKKIKELLSSEDVGEGGEENTGEGTTEGVEPELRMPEEVSEEEPQEEPKNEIATEEAPEPEQKEESDAEDTPDEEKAQAKEEVSEKEEPVSNETAPSFQAAFEKLESCRKGTCNGDNGDVSYFENNERIVLDAECLVSTLNNSFEETKKLFLKLSQTESPKDQFFTKQEIIRHQETLHKAMLRSIRMCEKENCSLPDYSLEILNVYVLKNVLEMVSMQNWSNQKDFATFDNFIKSLNDSFYSRITPPVEYIQSIIKQLELEEK
jgi:hypothetical protein